MAEKQVKFDLGESADSDEHDTAGVTGDTSGAEGTQEQQKSGKKEKGKKKKKTKSKKKSKGKPSKNGLIKNEKGEFVTAKEYSLEIR